MEMPTIITCWMMKIIIGVMESSEDLRFLDCGRTEGGVLTYYDPGSDSFSEGDRKGCRSGFSDVGDTPCPELRSVGSKVG